MAGKQAHCWPAVPAGDHRYSNGVDTQAWICPSCDRRVPPRVDECRCGFDQADLPFATDARQIRGEHRKLVPLTVLAMVAAVGAGAALWGWRVSARAETAAPVAALAAPPVPPTTEPSMPARTPLTTEFARLAPVTAAADDPAAAPPPASLEDVVSQTLPAVASIDAGRARGTGFFIKPDTVLTNAHVIQGVTTVQLAVGNASYSARVMIVNTGTDLAVLQVSNPNPRQPTLSMGSVNSTRVGEEVVAIGSALGVLSNTVTRGIVSALRKAGNTTLIQTDAAINPGNSGGPLLNRSGQVIGINSLGVSRQAAEGLAFAVAIDHASPLLNGQTSETGTTLLGSIQEQLSGTPSDAGTARTRGEGQYAEALQVAGRAADSIDSLWNRYAADCVVRAPRSGDRVWFAAFEGNAVEVSRSAKWNCASWLDTVRERADEVRAMVQQASEAARHNGVYPGVQRDMRRRYKLDWSGW
jgi:S1-C subfamily serine protease